MSIRPNRGVRPGMSKFELELRRAYLAWKPEAAGVRGVSEKPAEEEEASEEEEEIPEEEAERNQRK